MEVQAKSQVYETPPWGYDDQLKFKPVIKVNTYLEPGPLLKHIKRLEVTRTESLVPKWAAPDGY
jgi:7,8-dihydro-6-hydroxymethylpterin-pyrophosphokinase